MAKKSLIPTEKGLLVYELVKERKIADVAMTSRMGADLAEDREQQSRSAAISK